MPAPRRRACRAALPLRQPPQVALDLARVELAAGQVHVGRRDQPALVAGQRHPLGQHVVGVGQPRAAVRPRVVGEGDAVLVEQPVRLRQVGDDRPVRIDQVGVRRAAGQRPTPGPAAVACDAPDADEAEVAVHRPLLVVDARAQQRPRALLGAALAAGVVGHAPGRGGAAPDGATTPPPAGATIRSESSARATSASRRERAAPAVPRRRALAAARGPREEDHALGVARDVLERTHHLRACAVRRSARGGTAAHRPASS